MKKNNDHPRIYHLIAVCTISIVCAIIYSNTLNSPFVFDDAANIKDNPYIRITGFNFTTLYEAAFNSPSSRRPVANMSFAVNYFFGKYDVSGYHLVNIIIHLINGILVYFLAGIIFKHQSGIPLVSTSQSPNSSIPQSQNLPTGFLPLLSALIFVAHPIQTQSVTYIVQRMNCLAVMFYLLALLLYLYGRLSPIKWKQVALWTGGFLAWILALGTKEIAATLPVVLFIVEWFFFQNLSRQWLKKNIKYFIGLMLLLMLIALIYTNGMLFSIISAGYADRDFSMVERMLTQTRVILFYLGLILFPHPSRFNLLHTIQPSQSLFDPVTTLLSLLTILMLIGCAIGTAKRYRIISFCILWFFIHMLMESSIISLEMIFEHRLYLPMIGLSLLSAYFLSHLAAKNRAWFFFVCLSLIVSLGAATIMRNSVWHDGVTLWTDVIDKSPNNHRAHNNLGIQFAAKGKNDEAIHHYTRALEINPGNAEVYNNLGVSLVRKRVLKGAIDHFLMALELKPDYGEAYINLGVALTRIGNLKEAVRIFHVALQIKPDNAGIYNNLGVALERQGNSEKALEYYKKALRLKPDYAEAHNNLGIVLIRHGLYDEAIRHFTEALRIDPDDEETKHNLELGLQRMKNAAGKSNTHPTIGAINQ